MPSISILNARLARGLWCCAAASLVAWGVVPAGERGTPPRLLVVNRLDDSLMAFELPSHRPCPTLTVGDEPHEVAVMPDGSKAYVSNVGDGSITVIDLATWSVSRTLTPERFDNPHGLGITHDGRFLLATSAGSRRFYQFDTKRDALIRALTSTEEGMHMIAMPPRGWNAYAVNRKTNSVTVLNAKSLRIKDHIEVGSGPEGVALTPDGRFLLVALQNAGEVVIMKAGSERVRARLETGRTPIRIAVTPDGSLALVSNRDGDDVAVIDLTSNSLRGTIEVGESPGGLVISPDGLTAYVANNDSNSVSVISIGEMRGTESLDVGAHPDGLAIAPGLPGDDGSLHKKKRSRRSGAAS